MASARSAIIVILSRSTIYVINDRTAKPNPDGIFAIHFDGDPKAVNYMPIMDGWNYTVRLYQQREEILSGKWVFPDPKVVTYQFRKNEHS